MDLERLFRALVLNSLVQGELLSHTGTLDNSSDMYFGNSFDYVNTIVFNAVTLLVGDKRIAKCDLFP